MNINKLKEMWLAEQEAAHMRGWDFSHIDGRFTQDNDLPWNYEEIVRSYLQKDMQLLDIDTGGGEFLLTLGHPHENTFATEGYLPNVVLCEQRLLPLGIKFKKMSEYDNMPFDDDTFDIIINRHGNYDACELYRVLKPNGLFVTQQVGCNNDKELIELLCPDLPKPFPKAALKIQSELLSSAGFKILCGQEAYRPIKFFDVGALVWFAGIIKWEFRGFSVESCFDRLLEAQSILERSGSVDGTAHRYMIVAQK